MVLLKSLDEGVLVTDGGTITRTEQSNRKKNPKEVFHRTMRHGHLRDFVVGFGLADRKHLETCSDSATQMGVPILA
jgi:hypothetical protein